MPDNLDPLFSTTKLRSQFAMGVLGVGLVWLFFGISIFWTLGYPQSPYGFGTALAHVLVPSLVVVGGHEIWHYLVAEEYYDNVYFAAFESTTTLTLVSLGGALALVLVDVFTSFSPPTWLLIFAVSTPGAVVAKEARTNPEYMDETALAGPLWNVVVGMGLWWFVFDGQFMVSAPSTPIFEASMAWTMVLSLYLGGLNALPAGPFDGAKVWAYGGLVNKTILLVIIAVPWAIFLGLI